VSQGHGIFGRDYTIFRIPDVSEANPGQIARFS
jgi:hypothetical protein